MHFVVAHVSVDFRRPVEVGDLVRIFLRTRYVSTSSFAMDYEIFEVKSGQRAATAKTVLVTYDWENGRSMPVPDWVRAGLEAVEGGPLPKSPGEAIPPTC
ncbi:MAG: thioesterase family protein [Candidatus Eisenbacteria bacterium]